ncbi:hypothetical protein RJ639_032346 [Escallonia herrerae]|uniref:Cucumisin n=1 Tax=Escallonia herrerae TaxID=1293975 RepID=A0AA88WVS2_9ASTE|nr:hypothetical protein RJ639_032346 [Escallonia herrerae]
MATIIFCISWLLITCISSVMLSSVSGAFNDDRKAYIVYMGDRPKGDISPSSLHMSMLNEILGSEASTYLLYSYKRSFNGFVVKLTEEEKLRVAAMDEVVSVFPNEKKQLHTTRSWDFMGFPQQVNRTTLESDIIIGVLDTGIWPESNSFKDEGFGPPPSRWKGACQTTNFTCNKTMPEYCNLLPKFFLQGVSINTFDQKNAMYPIIYGGAVPNTTANYTKFESRYCFRNSLDSNLVKDKIILCDSFGNGASALVAGAAGTVMRDEGNKDVAYVFPLPATYLGVEDGATVFNYINSTRNPKAIIYKSNEVKDTLAPYVATFSSRGPNTITNDILKVNCVTSFMISLAFLVPQSLYHIHCKLVIESMPNSLIDVVLVLSAFPLNDLTSPEAEFAYGAGHINPLKAVNPGLVYDAGVVDYIKFLCGQGYNTTDLRLVTGDSSTCTKATTGLVWDLNLPSFALSAVPLHTFNRKFTRTVTNVGSPMSTYRVTIKAPDSLKISVEPAVLAFKSLGQKLPFVVKVQGLIGRTRVSASMVWDDGVHTVRSPIVVYGF